MFDPVDGGLLSAVGVVPAMQGLAHAVRELVWEWIVAVAILT